jgi:hypothetical protein
LQFSLSSSPLWLRDSDFSGLGRGVARAQGEGGLRIIGEVQIHDGRLYALKQMVLTRAPTPISPRRE